MEEKRKVLKNEGFSLVELIIVIAIMGILVGVVGTQVVPYMEKAREAKDKQILSEVATAFVSAITLCGESSRKILFNCPLEDIENANGVYTEYQKELSDQIIELLLPEGEVHTKENLKLYMEKKFTSKKAKTHPRIFISYYPQIGKAFVFLSDTELGDGTYIPGEGASTPGVGKHGIIYSDATKELEIRPEVFMYVESN